MGVGVGVGGWSQGPCLTMMPETKEMILGSSTDMPVIHLLGLLVTSRERQSHWTPARAIEFRA